MKKLILLLISAGAFAATAFAQTVFKIKVTNFQFNPKTVNARVGDKIKWVWKNGSHTTTSTSVPAGAATWNVNLNSGSTKFVYKIKVAGTYQFKCTPHNSMGMNGSFTVSNALAAGLKDFSVSNANAGPVLNWKTSSGKDLAYFSVQRSGDGQNFVEIARVNPSGLNRYQFKDDNTINDKFVYYQVEMVDVKGERQLTPVKMFRQKGEVAKLIASMSPNPISSPGHLMLQFNSDKDGSMQVQLYSMSGAILKQTQMSAMKGLNNGHFHLGDLTPGTYYAVFTLGNKTEKHIVVVK